VIAVRRKQQRRRGLQLGSVVHAVLHHAHCPVVLLPVRDD
jgi:nucleotide-binding universal stress UspA family protein